MLAIRSSSWVLCFGLVVVFWSFALYTVAKAGISPGYANKSFKELALVFARPFWRRRGVRFPVAASTGVDHCSCRRSLSSPSWIHQYSGKVKVCHLFRILGITTEMIIMFASHISKRLFGWFIVSEKFSSCFVRTRKFCSVLFNFCVKNSFLRN